MREFFLLKITSLSILLCSTVSLFGMINCNKKLISYKKHQPIVVDYEKTLQEIKQAFQEVDQTLIEDGVRNACISKDLLVHIGYGYSVKNELKNTCRFLRSKLSKTKQNMYQCALNKPYLGKKDVNLAILNAARDKRTDVMISILNNTQERQFYYDVFARYSSEDNGERYVIFDLPEICEVNEMGSYYDIINFPLKLRDAEQKIFKYNLKKAKKRTFSLKTISLMVEAAFGSVEDVMTALSSRVDKIGMDDLLMVFAIAIEQNNLDRLRALSLKAKKMIQRGTTFVWAHCYSVYDTLLITAMEGNKKEAFGILAEIDPFNCLNFCTPYGSTLDRIIESSYNIHNRDEYIALYKQHGGEQSAAKIQTTVSVCVLS